MMNAIEELDAVALTCDLPKYGLVRGEVGTAVLAHGEGAAFEVEFADAQGRAFALLPIAAGKLMQLHDAPVAFAA